MLHLALATPTPGYGGIVSRTLSASEDKVLAGLSGALQVG
jgi:hypothetical protein